LECDNNIKKTDEIAVNKLMTNTTKEILTIIHISRYTNKNTNMTERRKKKRDNIRSILSNVDCFGRFSFSLKY